MPDAAVSALINFRVLSASVDLVPHDCVTVQVAAVAVTEARLAWKELRQVPARPGRTGALGRGEPPDSPTNNRGRRSRLGRAEGRCQSTTCQIGNGKLPFAWRFGGGDAPLSWSGSGADRADTQRTEVGDVMSTDGEPTLQVVSKPDPATMRLLAHEIAVRIESATEQPERAAVADRTTQATGGSPTITPSHNAAAQAILKEVGDGPILVVPSSVPMQPGNPAICLGDQEQINTYKQHIQNRASSYDPAVNIDAWLEGLSVNTILVSESVLNDPSEINKRAVIYHEFGHTFLGRTETAAVFAHELKGLSKKFGKPEVVSWLKAVRDGGTYYVSYAHDPGLKDLTEILASLDFDLATKKEKKAQNIETSLKSRLASDHFDKAKISGQLSTFKKKAGTDEDLPAGLEDMAENTEFDWAGHTWRVYPRVYDYSIELVNTSAPLCPSHPGRNSEVTRAKSRRRWESTTAWQAPICQTV